MMEENNGTMSITRRCVIGVLCERTSLFLLVTGYTLLGAIIFKTIEGGEHYDAPVDFKKSREDCLKELWIITERLNVLYEKNWTKLVTEQLKRFERSIVDSGKNESPFSASRTPWTFGSALLYSITLLTTIGYSKLSPKTVLGKISAMIYAIVGVPLMLILLSALGGFLAKGVRKGYSKICCFREEAELKRSTSSVGYHKAPISPTGKFHCKSHGDSASIQIAFPPTTPNHIDKLTHNPHQQQPHRHHQPHNSSTYIDHQDVPKRALLATVRSSHTRGRGRQTGAVIRQALADAAENATLPCPAHALSRHGTPQRNAVAQSAALGTANSDPEDAEDTDENELVICPAHDTPSRIPLIWRPPEPPHHRRPPSPATPTVPALLVLTIFVAYVCAGAFLLCSSDAGWDFLDAVYFCFIALSTVGIGDGVPPPQPGAAVHGQLQQIACCVYVFVGLVVVAMCFSLVHEEITSRYRQIANNVGLKH